MTLDNKQDDERCVYRRYFKKRPIGIKISLLIGTEEQKNKNPEKLLLFQNAKIQSTNASINQTTNQIKIICKWRWSFKKLGKLNFTIEVNGKMYFNLLYILTTQISSKSLDCWWFMPASFWFLSSEMDTDAAYSREPVLLHPPAASREYWHHPWPRKSTLTHRV